VVLGPRLARGTRVTRYQALSSVPSSHFFTSTRAASDYSMSTGGGPVERRARAGTAQRTRLGGRSRRQAGGGSRRYGFDPHAFGHDSCGRGITGAKHRFAAIGRPREAHAAGVGEFSGPTIGAPGTSAGSLPTLGQRISQHRLALRPAYRRKTIRRCRIAMRLPREAPSEAVIGGTHPASDGSAGCGFPGSSPASCRVCA
jgi:hypothetical protein